MLKAILLLLVAFVAGCGLPSFLITPVSDRNTLEENKVLDGEGLFPAKVVIIPVEGMILNARREGLLGSGENSVSLLAQQLKKAEEDPSVKAVVLRINSPGGTVTASDTIYDLVRDFRKKTNKPVIASVQEVAASGGYYVASASDLILAQPTSVVGSIGVIFTTFDVEGTLGKIGARTYTIKSGRLKDMGSPFKAMTEEERQVIQAMINDYFGRFQGVVQNSRKLSDEQLVAVTDGRVFTGEQALGLKLIDRIGSLEDAIELARAKAKAKGAKAVLYIRPYGYGGSIYATNELPNPQASSPQINLPVANDLLPTGFYYLWRPGI